MIEGGVCRLRPPRAGDADVMLGWFEDVEVTARIGRRFPQALEQEREWLRERATDQTRISWVIEHEGRVVGTTSIVRIDWSNQSAETGTLIGDKGAWGRGIARELMRRRADFAFSELPLRKLRSSFLEGNEASRRAQLGAGYREVGRLRGEFFRGGRWLDLILTELMREDWQARRGTYYL